jgi:tetratricopeptide (TPR) repeat protein
VTELEPNYRAGKTAFERGEYRQAVDYFNAALAAATNPNTSLGGEVQIWLVTALEAAGNRREAIALCQQLARHPHLDTRQTSKRMLYIMQAPELTRKAEWLSEIPDLSQLDDRETSVAPKANSPNSSSKNQRSPAEEYADFDLSQVNTKDNGFVWLALVAMVLTTIGLWLVAKN